MHARISFIGAIVALLTGFVEVDPLEAGEIKRANTSNNLGNTSAWVGGVRPTAGDVALWDETVANPAYCTVGAGSLDQGWGGIRVANPAATVVITKPNNSRFFMLGSDGIDMSSSTNTQDFEIDIKLLATNSQTWNIKAGRTFKFDSNLDILDNSTITFPNAGNLESTGGANDPVIRLGAGSTGTATINQSAGTIRCSATTPSNNVIVIGKFPGNTGIYNLSGGTLDADDLPTAVVRIADQAGTDGRLNISGSGQAFAGVVDVGNQGAGLLTLADNGALTLLGDMNVPRNSGGTGLVDLNGGVLTVPKISGFAGGTLNFNGGTLKAADSAADFVQGLGQANITEPGARIDTAGFDVTVRQLLAHGGSAAIDGGIVKSGAGTLTLTAANTYTGTNRVTAGKLELSTVQAAGGRIVVADGAAAGVSVGAPGTTLKTAGLVLGSSSGATFEFNLGSANPIAPLLYATNLETHGVITVNVAGVGLEVGQFPLIKYSGAIGGSGYGAFSLVGLPFGVTANLVNNSANSSVDLNVTVAPKLIWTAANSSDWDIGITVNWLNSSTSASSYYTDGLPVVFPDTANSGTVQITTQVSPAGTTVTNDLLAYSFNGSGSIISGALKKEGPGILTFNSPQNYPGDTIINGGTLRLGASDVLPDDAGKGNLLVNGTLDLAGSSDTINGLNGAGIVDTSSGTVVLTIGNNDASSAFSGTLQNSGGTLSLVKTGAGILALSGNNTYSGQTMISSGNLQVGHDNALGASEVRFESGTLSSDGTTPRTIPNTFVIGGNVTFGNAINNGVVTLSGPMSFISTPRTISVPAEAVFTGPSSDGSLVKAGAGTLTLKGSADWTLDSEVNNGSLVLNGAAVTNSMDVRPDCTQGSGSTRLSLINGAILALNSGTANLRAGYDGNVTSTNYLDIAARVLMPYADLDNGKMILGAGVKRGVANILPGADLEVSAIAPADTHLIVGGSESEVNLDGGTIRPRASTTAFMEGLTEANVLSGGAVFDTAGFDITVAQPLQAASAGGLTKNGPGTLTLTGTNTYTGATVINNGTLVMTASHAGGGALTANDGSALQVKVASAGTTLNASTVTLGSAGGAAAEFNLGTLGNPTAPVLNAATLVTHGSVQVKVFGAGLSVGQFTLIKYSGTIGGGGYAAFASPVLPLGVTASLVSNTGNSSVDLLITAVVPLTWSGAINGWWDIAGTANWKVGAVATTYQEPVVPGPAVRFDESATGTRDVILATTVSPASVTISNTGAAYTLSGIKISGPASFTKQGPGMAVLATTPNDYTGPTLISAGKLALGSWDVLPDGEGKGDVTVNGTLDLAGFNDTINGLNGSGIIDASAGASTLAVGSNDASGVFSGQIRNAGGSLALTKVGTGSITLSGNNSYASGTTIFGGSVQLGGNNVLGYGLVTLSSGSGTLASDSTASRLLTNSLLVTANLNLGDSTNTGVLTLSGPVDFNGATRRLTCNSDVLLTGNLANGAFNKEGPATLTTSGIGDFSSGCEVHDGVWIINGGSITNTLSVRPDSTDSPGFARLVVTNGGAIILTGTTVNGRVGFSGGSSTTTNILDLAGLYLMPNADSLDGLMTISRSGNCGFLNLYAGGDLQTRQITKASGGTYAEFNFDGGIVRAMGDQPAYITGLDLASIRNGGATLDTAEFTIGIPQPLLSGGAGGLTKLGSGTLLLNAANTYTGQTLVSAGTLGGNGALAGPVAVASGAVLSPGTGIGQLTINNSLILSNSSATVIELDKTSATNDVINGLASITYGGTLNMVNLGSDLAAGDSFTIFKSAAYNGSFTTLSPTTPGSGLTWDTSQLLVNGTLRVASSSAPPSITAVFSGGNLDLTWPATGWRLEGQTNSPGVGLTPTWYTVEGSTAVNHIVIPVSPTAGSSFFRLVNP